MKKRIYIAINGILSRPEASANWTDRFVTHSHKYYADKCVWAEKLEYLATPLLRRFKQQKLARKFAKRISFYSDQTEWDIILCGHSNGADLILRILDLLDKSIKIKEIHFVAPACSVDFKKNGILEHLKSGKVGNFKLYIGGKDVAMLIARFSKFLLGKLGLGYGALGSVDHNELRTVLGQGNVIYQPNYNHSTWFEESNGNFSKFMEQVISNSIIRE